MTQALANTCVLLETGDNLAEMDAHGVTVRELRFVQHLLESYERVAVVSLGDRADADAGKAFEREVGNDRCAVIVNANGSDLSTWRSELPGIVAQHTKGGTAIVRTSEMLAGRLGVEVTRHLRAKGVRTGLVARGGYLWTRFLAHEMGPHSSVAMNSASEEKELCSHADIVVGTTAAMVEDLAWRYGLNPARTCVVPNFVLDDVVLPENGRDTNLIVCAGELLPRKRVELLIEMVIQLREQRPGVVLEVIGDGPSRASLEAMATSRGAPVKFTGRIAHLALLERMATCAIFVQASELEGQPKTVLEAMASGATVLVADAPGLANIVQHGVTGLKCAADPDAFAHVVNDLLSDDEWREVLGSGAARMSRATYGLSQVMPMELEVHRRALARAGQDSARVSA